MCNGFKLLYEREDVLESGFYKSPLGYENVDWFVEEVKESQNEMKLYFQNTKRISIRLENLKKILKVIICVDFVKNILNLIKLRIIVI